MTWFAILMAAAVLLISHPARAGSVQARFDKHQSFVGTPIVLNITLDNVASHEAPAFPQVDGLTITSTGTPSSMRSVQIVNGRRTEQATLTYQFLIDADRPGTWTTPTLHVTADDNTYTLNPTSLTFLSAADSSLMRSEIHGGQSHAWLGDVVPLTLRVLVKPFADPQLPDGTLSAMDMWSMVDLAGSKWGPLQPEIDRLSASRAMPHVTIADVEGDRWYAYDIRRHVRLLQAGELDVSDVRVRMNYPESIGRGRASILDLRPRLQVTRSRPVTTAPAPIAMLVETPPSEGRPAGWSGAVGQYRFDVTASPTDVVVGEPITLTMRIQDTGDTEADLELLAAPLLDQDATLTQDFRVPSDRPGGVLSGRTKTFTQSIRPATDAVTQIPPIGFPFFNPASESYEIAFSRPIDLKVKPSARIDADAIAGALPGVVETPEELTLVSGGLVANYTDPAALLSTPSAPGAAVITTVLLAPPLLFASALLLRRRRLDPTRDARVRSRVAARQFAESIRQHQDAAAVAEALRDLVTARLGLPEGTRTRHEIRDALAAVADPRVAEAVDAELGNLEQRVFTGSAGEIDQQTCERLVQLAGQVEEATR